MSRFSAWICFGLTLVAGQPIAAEDRSTEAPAQSTSAVDSLEVLTQEGKYAEVESRARILLARMEADHGPDAIQVAQVLDYLVTSLIRGGKLGDPETRLLAERAVEIKRRCLGEKSLGYAKSLNLLGNIFLLSGDYASARPHMEQVLAIREKVLGPDHLEVAKSLENLGIMQMETGNYTEARSYYERALTIKEKQLGSEDRSVGQTLSNLANLLTESGDYAAAESCFVRAIAVLEASAGPEHPMLANCLNNYAAMLDETARYAEGLSAAERSLAIREKTLGPEHPDVAPCLNNIGVLLDDSGQYSQALPRYERALVIYRRALGPEHPYVAETLHNLGNVNSQLGDYVRAAPLYDEALAILEKSRGPDHPDVARCLTSQATLHSDQGDRGTALTLFERALAIQQQTGREDALTASIHNELGTLLTSMGELEDGRQHLQRGLEIREKIFGPDSPRVSESLDDLADYFMSVGQPVTARPLYERSAAIRERTLGDSHPEVAETLVQLSRTLDSVGETQPAFDAALRAEDISREHLSLTARTLSHHQALGLLKLRVRGIDVALAIALRAESREITWRAWNAQVRSRALVLDELAVRHRSIANTQDLEVQGLETDFQAASQRLANLLVRGMRDLPAERYRGLLEAAREDKERAERLLAGRSAMFQAVRAHEELGLDAIAMALPSGTAVVAFVLYSRIDPPGRLTKEPVTSGRPMDTADVPPRQAYIAFVLRAGEHSAKVFELAEAGSLDSLVMRWRREVVRTAPVAAPSAKSPEERYRAVGSELRRALWDPFAAQLHDVKLVFVVPDGTLHLVNFAALPIDGSRYMIEQNPTIHLVSAERDLLRSWPEESGKGLLVVGGPDYDAGLSEPAAGAQRLAANDSATPMQEGSTRGYRGKHAGCDGFQSLHFEALPASEEEAREIAALWGGSADRAGPPRSPGGHELLLTGAAASEAAFKREAPGRCIVHVATHGFFIGSECRSSLEGSRGIGGLKPAGGAPVARVLGDENPMLLSGLVFSGANHREAAGPDEEDGILTAEEIAALDLSGVEWAVLSACDTGVGEIRAGEGVLGLRRAFEISGTGSLIMSLWSVDDEATGKWMKALYEARLMEGKSTAESVRAASLKLLTTQRRERKSAHPLYWAGFVAAGEWR